MAKNWWDSYADAPAASTTPGFVPLTGANPKVSLDIIHQRGANAIQDAELARQGALNTAASAGAAKAAADARYADRTAKAQSDKAVADALVAQQNAAGAAAGGMVPNSNVHGDDYFRAAKLPSGLAATVRGVATGNVALPANALRSPYWQQVLQHTLNYDPEFNASDYNTRARTRADFASGKMGINITALNTALGHAGEVLNDTRALNNSGGLLGTSIWNPIANAYLRHSGDPRVTNFENDTLAFGGEMGKVFAGPTGGGQGEREDWRTTIPINGSPAQQRGVLTQDAKLLRSRIEAINEQYRRGMGRTADISDLLDPHARQVYQSLLAGDGGAATPGGVSGTAGGPPLGGGSPGGGMPNTGSAVTIATGPTRLTDDPKAAGIIDALVRRGASADEINAAIAPLGFAQVKPGDVAAAQAFLKRNPGYKGSLGGAQRSVPTTAWNRFTASPIGTGVIAAADSALAGTTDEIGGTINSAFTGQPLRQAIAQADAMKKAAFAAHPDATLVGNLIGGTAGMYAGGSFLGGTAATAALGRAAPYAGAALYGAATGAGQDNDSRLGGAAAGAIGGLVGQGIGHAASIPIGAGIRAVAGTAPGRAIRGMMFRGFDPAPKLTPGQSSALNVINGAGPDVIRSTLSDAQRLGVPMSLADTAPSIADLAGSAVRHSPQAADYANTVLLPRGRGQYDRLSSAVTRDLGPVGNIPQISADLGQQARTQAAPLYDKAFQGGSLAPLEHQFTGAFQDSSAAVAQAQRDLSNAQNRLTQSRAGVSRAGDNVYGANAALGGDRDAAAAVATAQRNLEAAQASHRANLDRLKQAQADGSAGKPGAVWSPRVQQFLDDLISKAGLSRGLEVQRLEALADGRKFDPSEFAIKGFDQHGQPIVAAVPNMRTLDAVKRGFDEILNDYPRSPGGQLQLDQRGHAVDKVRRSMLSELDNLNPDYSTARAAWGGPMSSREALSRGQSLYGDSPDVVGMAMQGQTPEQLGQMQLGFRGAMMDHAGKIRDSANPWEATLGSPAARGRIDAAYPGNPGNADLFRQRDLEAQMAATGNRIVGNSMTAGRNVADENFKGGSQIPSLVADVALASHGVPPLTTIAQASARGKLGNIIRAGADSRAAARGAEIAPLLMNPDPAAASATVDDLVQAELRRRAYVQASRPTRLSGMFGRGFGVGLTDTGLAFDN